MARRETRDRARKTRPGRARAGLPTFIRELFWDHAPNALCWDRDRDLIVARLLATGEWASLRWLRARLGDEALRSWIAARGGAGLEARRLRFFELVLDLPHRQVNAWLRLRAEDPWQCRLWPRTSRDSGGAGA